VAPPLKKWLKPGRGAGHQVGCAVQVHKQAPLKATAEAKEEADEADVPNWLNYSPRTLHFSTESNEQLWNSASIYNVQSYTIAVLGSH